MNDSLCCPDWGRGDAKPQGFKEQLHLQSEPVSSTDSNGGLMTAAAAGCRQPCSCYWEVDSTRAGK